MDSLNRTPLPVIGVLIVWLLLPSFSLAVDETKPADKPSSQPAAPSAPNASSQPAAPSAPQSSSGSQVKDLFKLDITDLAKASVRGTTQATTLNAPSTQLNAASPDIRGSSSTGELLREVPTVNARRLSALNLDPRVRGFNSSELNATANGMNQLKTRIDIDSLFSQIDPGIVRNITVIDGPYTSLYGPGFAFLAADLISAPRFSTPQTHLSQNFTYGTNAQSIYSRSNVVTGANDWGVVASYGLRDANDYVTGGPSGSNGVSFQVPSSYQKWDGFFSVGYDLNDVSRIEFDYLRTDLNNVRLPGVVYDLDSSVNNQFNLRYIVQEHREDPQQLLVQTWHQETFYRSDASAESKQQSFYYAFVTLPSENEGYNAVNTLGDGHLVTTGLRCLRTFGQADAPQWTIGADWRRSQQRYQERDVDPLGIDAFNGYYFGIPKCRTDDIGVLTNVQLPASDRLSFSIGGRVDYAQTWLDTNDPVITARDPGLPIVFQPGFDMPNYTLGMAYAAAKLKLNDHDALNVGSGFAMRAPDLAELYSSEPYVPMYRFGNSFVDGLSNLSPEKTWQFDLGLTGKRGPVRYGARGFYTTIWDYVMAVPAYTSSPLTSTHVLGRNFQDFPLDWREDYFYPDATNGDTVEAGYQVENVGLATISGGDLFAEVELRKGLTVFGSMAYVHGQNLRPIAFYNTGSDDSRGGLILPIAGTEPLPGMYPFNGRLSLRVFDPEEDRWGMEFAARFVHSQNEVAFSVSETPSAGFSVFDLRGYYRIRKNIRLHAEIQNLFNRYYYEPGSLVIINPVSGLPTYLPEPGFTFLTSVEARF
jgi:iron complex outermembrane recepter protein